MKPASAKRISHARNLLWWAILAVIPVSILYVGAVVPPEDRLPPPPPGNEVAGFVSLRLPKIGSEEGQIPAIAFESMMQDLHDRGFTAITLANVVEFYQGGAPLPNKPILLTFDDAWSSTIEVADRVLRELGWRAVVFTDVEEVDGVNLSLLSRRRLAELVETGRWEAAVAGCPDHETPFVFGASAARLRDWKQRLEEWIEEPVEAVSCAKLWGDGMTTGEWESAAEEAGFPLGFVRGPWRANYRDRSPLALSRTLVQPGSPSRELAAAVAERVPRRSEFVDRFEGDSLSPAWEIDAGKVAIDDRKGLHLVARHGPRGGRMVLKGSERWRDAVVAVDLSDYTEGQFWIHLRDRGGDEFVRLGVSEGKILFQRRLEDGLHLIGSTPVAKKRHRLELRVLGGRAVAFVDGKPVASRPERVPEGLDSGAASLSVWNSEGRAAAWISRVAAKPLSRRAAIVPLSPSARTFVRLREELDELAILSPVRYRWEGGRLHAAREDPALAMFGHHYRFDLYPALEIEGRFSKKADSKLASAVRRQLVRDDVDGVHVILPDGTRVDRDLLVWVVDFRAELEKASKRAVFTLRGSGGQSATAIASFIDPLRLDVERSLEVARSSFLLEPSAL